MTIKCSNEIEEEVSCHVQQHLPFWLRTNMRQSYSCNICFRNSMYFSIGDKQSSPQCHLLLWMDCFLKVPLTDTVVVDQIVELFDEMLLKAKQGDRNLQLLATLVGMCSWIVALWLLWCHSSQTRWQEDTVISATLAMEAPAATAHSQ